MNASLIRPNRREAISAAALAAFAACLLPKMAFAEGELVQSDRKLLFANRIAKGR